MKSADRTWSDPEQIRSRPIRPTIGTGQGFFLSGLLTRGICGAETIRAKDRHGCATRGRQGNVLNRDYPPRELERRVLDGCDNRRVDRWERLINGPLPRVRLKSPSANYPSVFDWTSLDGTSAGAAPPPGGTYLRSSIGNSTHGNFGVGQFLLQRRHLTPNFMDIDRSQSSFRVAMGLDASGLSDELFPSNP